MKVIICYSPDNHSHSIVNSAMSLHDKVELKNIKLEIFNT